VTDLPTAPMSPEALHRALRPFGEGTMLPAQAYTSPEVLAWERRNFFAGTWTCLGRREALAPLGSTQVATMVGDIGVLLLVAGAGPVEAFANSCRHRGHELLGAGETSTKRAVVCLRPVGAVDRGSRFPRGGVL